MKLIEKLAVAFRVQGAEEHEHPEVGNDHERDLGIHIPVFRKYRNHR